MPSVTEVLNRALALIGEERITSISETSQRAQSIRDTWAECRQGLIAAHTWNFAAHRRLLTPDAQGPGWGWAYRFRKPQAAPPFGPWLRTIGIWEDEEQRCPAAYQDEGGFWLLANVDRLYLRYIADVEDPNRMLPAFREAAVYKLAGELAIALTNSNTMAERMLKVGEERLRRARSIDALDDAPQEFPISSWEQAMAGGGLGSY